MGQIEGKGKKQNKKKRNTTNSKRLIETLNTRRHKETEMRSKQKLWENLKGRTDGTPKNWLNRGEQT